MARKQRINFAKLPWQGQLFTPLQGPVGKQFVEGDPFLRSQLDRTLWHDEVTDTYVGSNHQIVTRADSRARELSHGAVRVVTLQDTEHPTLKQMIYQRNYVDVPEAIIQTQEGEFAKQIAEIAAQRNIPFNLPCKVTDLDVTADGEYIARPNFVLTQHPSLNSENNRKRFSRMENGFPVFDEKGEYIWYLRRDSSAGVYRNSSLGVSGSIADFGGSDFLISTFPGASALPASAGNP